MHVVSGGCVFDETLYVFAGYHLAMGKCGFVFIKNNKKVKGTSVL